MSKASPTGRRAVWLIAGAGAVLLGAGLAFYVNLPRQCRGDHCGGAAVERSPTVSSPNVPDAPQSEAAITGSLRLSKEAFAVGEHMTITLETSRDCHFFLFTLDAEGKLERHYPADNPDFYGDPVLPANVTRTIPVNGAAEVGPPKGRNEIGIVCSVEPFDKLGLGKESGASDRAAFVKALEEAERTRGASTFFTRSRPFIVN